MQPLSCIFPIIRWKIIFFYYEEESRVNVHIIQGAAKKYENVSNPLKSGYLPIKNPEIAIKKEEIRVAYPTFLWIFLFGL
jgi:hypothetical protein